MKKFKAGKYYVGDPCYVISDENWMPLLESTKYFENENQEYKGQQIFTEGTAHGDGCFTDNFGREYGVDAGLIGIIPFEVIDDNRTGDGGQIIEFEKDFEVYTSELGIFHFGDIVIDTAEEDYEEDNEEWEEDEIEEEDESL